jgi:hypothetical protein
MNMKGRVPFDCTVTGVKDCGESAAVPAALIYVEWP